MPGSRIIDVLVECRVAAQHKRKGIVMVYSEKELMEAKRQILSIIHKLMVTVETFQEKENADKLKSQITLAQRRIMALDIAKNLIDEKLDAKRSSSELFIRKDEEITSTCGGEKPIRLKKHKRAKIK